ncbi:MAG: S-methyl-5'-thioadenosine phosphorylase [Prolixibacteraceae bacterium]|nr:S-methyl-5'-thioadenosine phosphorylase [Prolixibacteraceae bacterium]
MVKFALIGGSGLEDPEILHNPGEIEINTPFGKPSSKFKTGNIEGVDVVILSRHGRDHAIPPSQVNNRANIWAIRELNCTHILATTACGSLREEIHRGDLVIVDQFIDFTRHRKITFYENFGNGDLKHSVMADPFDNDLRSIIIANAKKMGLKYHPSGTVITIEGPRFSTRAESNMFRSWGADVINMSVAPECILAKELNLPYAAIALTTDYDCWKTDEEPVTWEEILKEFNKNLQNLIQLLRNTITDLKI